MTKARYVVSNRVVNGKHPGINLTRRSVFYRRAQQTGKQKQDLGSCVTMYNFMLDVQNHESSNISGNLQTSKSPNFQNSFHGHSDSNKTQTLLNNKPYKNLTSRWRKVDPLIVRI